MVGALGLYADQAYLLLQSRADWLGDDSAPLEGFPWRGGAERDTTGILFWSEPFEVTLPTGEKVSTTRIEINLLKCGQPQQLAICAPARLQKKKKKTIEENTAVPVPARNEHHFHDRLLFFVVSGSSFTFCTVSSAGCDSADGHSRCV